jgi:hypothetical protein
VAHVLSLSAFESVVYLDSDVMMRNATEASLPELLQRYSAASHQSHYPQSASPAGAQLFFAWDTPYSLGPNAGFFVVHSSAAAREVLRAWWSLDPGPYGLSHAFEQQTLQWILMHTSRYRPLLRTLRLRAIEPPWRDAVHHLDHNTGTKARVWNIARAAAEGLARDPWLPRNESARLQSYLPLLRQSVRGKSMKVRQDVIRLVMAAIGLDLQRIGLASIANTSWGGDRVGHQIVHTSASCAGSVYVIPHFDATQSAAELLKPMLELSEIAASALPKVAAVVDVRGRDLFTALPAEVGELRSRRNVRIVFLDASDDVLVRRFEAVRRPHPLHLQHRNPAPHPAQRDRLLAETQPPAARPHRPGPRPRRPPWRHARGRPCRWPRGRAHRRTRPPAPWVNGGPAW